MPARRLALQPGARACYTPGMEAVRGRRSRRWWVYVVRCGGGALYTGIATDVERRLAEHRAGRGAKALRGRGPLELVLAREVGGRGLALRVEALVKRLGKADKERLAARTRALEPLIDAARRAARRARRRTRALPSGVR